MIQTDIIMCLQLAVKYENAVVDFRALQAAAVANRRDAIEALDELKKRILANDSSTLSSQPGNFDQNQALVNSASASLSVSPNPIPDEYVPNEAENCREKGHKDKIPTLARYLHEERRDSAVSGSVHASCKNTDYCYNTNPPLLGETSKDSMIMAKDIDKIFAAYQGLKIRNDRADAFAKLTEKGERSKQDTLSVPQDRYKQRKPKVPLQLPKEVSPVSKKDEVQPMQCSIYGQNKLNQDEERRLGEWLDQQQGNPLPLVSRWSATSAGSSNDSEHTKESSDPSSLYSEESCFSSLTSASSLREPASPQIRFLDSLPKSSHSTVPFWSLDTVQSPPSSVSMASSRTQSPSGQFSSRSHTPTLDTRRACAPLSHNASFEPSDCPQVGLVTGDQSHYDTSIPPLPISRPPSVQVSTMPVVPEIITTSSEDKLINDPTSNNNYLDFCEGAWAARECINKGMRVKTRLEGVFKRSQIWQCKHCLFDGPAIIASHTTKKIKRDIVVDPTIHQTGAGIRYRWSFLAKSHVKRTKPSAGSRLGATEEPESVYGCLVCSIQGHVSGIYGNVEALMNHISTEHVKFGSLDEASMAKANIVIGRIAGPDEEWDINITTRVMLYS